MAIGLFFGILTPVAQIFFAAVAAVLLRANLAVAAFSTLVTNPVTFLVYYAAYRVGSLLGVGGGSAADVALSQNAASHALEVGGWGFVLREWMSSVGAPLAVGVVTLAVLAALLGYFLVHALWRCRDALERRAMVRRKA